ncbi:MAG: ferredoxin [Desulfobacterales bacterium]|nr:ferredoxin [Desulfobacterales bacterium]
MKVPVVELSDCILCEVCTEICPEVFQMNAAGYVEVIDLDAYPEAEVDEAIKNCPVDCIFWENK